jgi:hypothetical protein
MVFSNGEAGATVAQILWMSCFSTDLRLEFGLPHIKVTSVPEALDEMSTSAGEI